LTEAATMVELKLSGRKNDGVEELCFEGFSKELKLGDQKKG